MGEQVLLPPRMTTNDLSGLYGTAGLKIQNSPVSPSPVLCLLTVLFLFFNMNELSPIGLWWRSHPFFILLTVAVGRFSDIFLYGMVVPVLPYLLRDRLGLPEGDIQIDAFVLLAAFSAASLVFALPAGWLVDWTATRRYPYLIGLIALTAATILFAVADTFVLLFVSRVLQGLSAALVSAAGLAMVIDTTGSRNLGKTLGTVRGMHKMYEPFSCNR
jgi:Major Facilitator Superfamily